jgi:DNA polymerase III delta subunit
MIRLFAGADSFAAYHAALDKAQSLASAQNCAVETVAADELTPTAFWDLVQQRDMFSTKKIVLAKRLLSNKELAKDLVEHIQTTNFDVVIWEPSEPDNRQAVVKALGQAKQVTLYAEPTEWELTEWLQQQFKQYQLQYPNLAAILIERIGSDKWRLQSEINKLAAFQQAQGKITEGDLELLVPLNESASIWHFLDTLADNNKTKLLKLYQQLSTQVESEQYLLVMLARELTLMAQVQAAQQYNVPTASLGLKDFVVKKVRAKLTKFNWAKLQKLAATMIRLDTAIKRGKVEPDAAIFLYLLSW